MRSSRFGSSCESPYCPSGWFGTILVKSRRMDSNSRSIVKALSYRILGSVATAVIYFVLTRNAGMSLGAGALDSIVKIGMYFVHERLWNLIDYGRGVDADATTRSIAKAMSYRVLGSASTALIFYVLSRDAKLSLGGGLVDSVLKIGVYFIHERLWNHISYGRPKPPEYEI